MGRRRGGPSTKDLMLAGAVSGVFQGINQSMADRRAASLKEIEMQYRTADRQADQKFRSELEDKRFQNNLTVAERTHELNSEPKPFDWNDKSLMSTYENVAEAKAADDPTLLIPRTKDGDTTASLKNTLWYANASKAERAIYDRVNKITESAGGLSAEKQQRAILELYAAFDKKDGYDKTAALKSLGVDPTLKGEALRDAVIAAYSGTVQSIVGTPPAIPAGGSAIPLVEEAPAATGAPAESAPADPAQYDSAMQQAREAIAANRDPEAVKQMLRNMGVPEDMIGTL